MFGLSRFVNGNKTTNTHAFECSYTAYVVDVAVINCNLALSNRTAVCLEYKSSNVLWNHIVASEQKSFRPKCANVGHLLNPMLPLLPTAVRSGDVTTP